MKSNYYTVGPLKITTSDRESVIDEIISAASDHRFLSVITPNASHLQMALDSPETARLFAEADVSLPDGWPIAWLLKKFSGDQRGRITGSDLSVDILHAAADQDLTVAIIGGTDATLDLAIEKSKERFPSVRFVRPSNNPHLPNTPTAESRDEFVATLNETRAHLVLLCLGAPKSELHLLLDAQRLHTGPVLCVGATVDFLAGTKARAPMIMQKLNLEWLFRLLQEPKRLTRRYYSAAIAVTKTYRLERSKR